MVEQGVATARMGGAMGASIMGLFVVAHSLSPFDPDASVPQVEWFSTALFLALVLLCVASYPGTGHKIPVSVSSAAALTIAGLVLGHLGWTVTAVVLIFTAVFQMYWTMFVLLNKGMPRD
jgi:hypothetical protein